MELPPDQHSRHDTCADNVLPLPFDAVNEILLRVPAKDLCRLRTVSQTWLSFLSNQRFIAEHKARHPGTHIVVGYNTALQEDRILYDICDLSGHIVKRVRAAGNQNELEWVMYTQPDLICIMKWTDMSIRLLNLATGVVYALPTSLAQEHAVYQQDVYNYCFTAAFGQVASTGVYKVLRVIVILENGPLEQLYEVFTLDDSNHGRWRAKQAPPYQVELDCRDNVVINGIVYFFLSYDVDEHKRRLASFNLETEEWSASIPGPLASLDDEDDAGVLYYDIHWSFQLTIGALGGSLVMACHPICSTPSSLDLWFLVDFEKGLWVKQYSIELSFRYPAYSIHPFLVLNDGRMVFVIDTINSGGLFKIYNPETKTSEDVMEMGYGVAFGLYTGSLLSLANSASAANENTTGFAEGP
ncbi:unnamed protein product [Urochloa decumbens]|uniref:F-box domain-containing protein n=1 Tax=Urochloa decumbens TaxID=240449 RepID=A0ABC9BFC2_9POAL